eukprot:gene15662-17242_t
MSASILKTCFKLSSRRLPEEVFILKPLNRTFIGSHFWRFSDVNDKKENKDGKGEDSETTVRPTEELEQLLSEKENLINEKNTALDELKDKYMRALAENENMLARNKKLVEDTRHFAIQSFSKDLLEVADVLEKAMESVPKQELGKNAHLQNLFEGLAMTDNQLQKVFKSHGLEKINPIGEKFDPNFHAAMFMQSAHDKEPGTVSIVNKIGYKLKGRPLRAALVGVVKG